jgi:hypothetical protein
LKMQIVGPMRWHAVDLDGTLAIEGDNPGAWSPYYIGDPIPAMVDCVKKWLKAGDQVSIFTARVDQDDPELRMQITLAIQGWCQTHIGQLLEITCVKSMKFSDYWDDRNVAVDRNTGKILSDPQSAFSDADKDSA